MKEKIKRAAIYARVSTDGQTTENQLRELRAVAERNGWLIVQEYIDQGISGAKGREQRPAFNALWKGATRREFDVVVVWAVDRLGRSLTHLVNFLSELHAKKVDLFIYQQGVDTTTPAGKALFGMMGVFAEFERSMIQERVVPVQHLPDFSTIWDGNITCRCCDRQNVIPKLFGLHRRNDV